MGKKEVEEQQVVQDEVEKEVQKEICSEEYMERLSNDLVEQKKKTDEYFDHLKRNMAEFDNFKKRMDKEKQSLYSTIVCDIISSILPVLDNFEQAINSECADEKYKQGIEMIYSSLRESLSKQGLEEIESLNQTFDPNFHEAVMHEQEENKGEKQIVQVFRKGYKINDKVIRHSMVKVVN